MLPTWEIKQLIPMKQTGLQKSQWRAEKRSDPISPPESFLKVKVWLEGANSFGLEHQECAKFTGEAKFYTISIEGNVQPRLPESF